MNAEFSNLLADLVLSHADVVPNLANGLVECKRFMRTGEISEFLDDLIRARIGIRVLAEHHLALMRPVPHHSGIIHHQSSPHAILKKCAPFAQELCELNFGSFPEFNILGHLDTTFPFIDVHLEYMLFELLKNSFRATVEFSRRINRSQHPPVEITIAQCADEVTLRIRDEGGGIPDARLKSVWDYSYTTVEEDSNESTDDFFSSSVARMDVANATGGVIAGNALPCLHWKFIVHLGYFSLLLVD